MLEPQCAFSLANLNHDKPVLEFEDAPILGKAGPSFEERSFGFDFQTASRQSYLKSKTDWLTLGIGGSSLGPSGCL